MENIKLEVIRKRGLVDVKDFCEIYNGLSFVGYFANIKTSKIIPGAIVLYNGKFYNIPSVCTGHAANDMVKTYVSLLETDYVPEECKPLTGCSIYIEIWDSCRRPHCIWEDNGGDSNDGNLLCSYAFYDNQLTEAKEIVKDNKYVDIFIKGQPISRKDFLES